MSSSPKSFVDKFKEQLAFLSEKAGIDSRLMIAGLGICLFFVFIGYFDKYITTIVGVAYPIFWSFRAIESPDSDDDKQWLTYWVVFALFTVLDLFSGFILKFIPFYFFFKLLFLIWCFLPNFRGASVIYDLFLAKLFKKYEKHMEEFSDNLMKGGKAAADQAKKTFIDNKDKIIAEAMKTAVNAKTN